MPKKCSIYKVKYYMCEYIYIYNTQKKPKKTMNGHLFNILHLLKKGQEPDSFSAHYKQRFNSTTSCTDLHKWMTFKVVKQLNRIGAVKTFTKSNCNLFMEERLTTLKNLREKCIRVMKNTSEIYRDCQHKTTFRQFSLNTDDAI